MGRSDRTRKFAKVKRLLSVKDSRFITKKPSKKTDDEESKVKEVQKNKLDIFKSMMDCLLAKCDPCITDCVIAELEKLGQKYRLALRLAKDPRMKRLTCCHKGTYADDCIVDRVTQHRCYIVGTNDKDLKRRLRKIPGVPVLYVQRGKYGVEKMPESITAVPIKHK